MPIELSDDVVTLKPMTLDDVGAHVAGEDAVMQRFLSGGVSTIETATAWIERNTESWRTGGPIKSFGVYLSETGDLIGMVEANLSQPGFRPGVANVSYGLHPHARGHGYASRAVELMLAHLGDSTDTDVALIQVHPENPASLRVAARVGFRAAGRWIDPDGQLLETFTRRVR